MLIIVLFYIFSYSQSINENAGLEKYKNYCESTYEVFDLPKKYKLHKLLVFHRHGDRSSLNVEYSQWKNSMCKVCDYENGKIINCRERKCKDGELTIKGYEQMKMLGQFIKKNYKKLLNDKVYLRCTSIERTQSSLHGVLTGLFGDDTDKKVEILPYDKDALLIRKDCLYLTEQVTNRVTSNFSAVASKDEYLKIDLPQRRADIYLTAMCNNVELDCSMVNCDKAIIEDYIKTSFKAWQEQADVMSRDEHVLKLTFGRFVDDLKKVMASENDLNIFSVHDSSLSMLLAGFGVNDKGHPAYASAIFVEILDDGSEKYLRIIYDTKVETTTIDDSEYIPLKKFTNYLNELKADEDYIEERCKKGLILEEEKIEREMDHTANKKK
ncbi:hypothetical protein BDAP_002051 [Binucleata daphniae]